MTAVAHSSRSETLTRAACGGSRVPLRSLQSLRSLRSLRGPRLPPHAVSPNSRPLQPVTHVPERLLPMFPVQREASWATREHSALQLLLLQICQRVREEFGQDAELSLELYRDPEIDD